MRYFYDKTLWLDLAPFMKGNPIVYRDKSLVQFGIPYPLTEKSGDFQPDT